LNKPRTAKKDIKALARKEDVISLTQNRPTLARKEDVSSLTHNDTHQKGTHRLYALEKTMSNV
jgi:hypothetical protein